MRSSGIRALACCSALLAVIACAETSSPSPTETETPASLAFSAQPSGAAGGTPFVTQPVVEVLNAVGSRVVGPSVSVTLALASNPHHGHLVGTTSVTTTSGLASFTDLAIDTAAGGYTLVAASGGVTPDTTSLFDVAIGPPARLRFRTSPAGGLSEKPFSTQPVVALLDAGGNQVSDSSRDITLVLGANPASARLSGTVTMPTDSGVAGFAGLATDRAGSGYTLVATSPDLVPDTSAAFDVAIQFQSITVANGMGCGLAVGGLAYCWGRNQLGGLGIGTSGTNRSRPSLVAGGLTFSVVDAGAGSNENGFWDGFGCGTTTEGDTYCWGRNNFGQLGNGNTGTDSDVPVLVSGGHTFAQISAGQDHACGLTVTGDAYCWGRNVTGGLGDNTTSDSNVPVLVLGSHTWSSIDATGNQTCAVDTSGAVYCWGATPSDYPGSYPTPPAPLNSLLTFRQVSTGWFLSRCAVTTADDAYCWGQNFGGELGNGSDTTDSAVPVAVSGGLKFTTALAGGEFACGLTVAGDAYCWGADFGLGNGTLGQGSFATSSVPLKVVGGLTFTALSVGNGQTCGITTSGAGYCWGAGLDGERGDGTFDPQAFSPVPIAVP